MEKVYLAMKQAGAANVVLGVLLTVISASLMAGGVLLLVHGARLLKRKSEIMI